MFILRIKIVSCYINNDLINIAKLKSNAVAQNSQNESTNFFVDLIVQYVSKSVDQTVVDQTVVDQFVVDQIVVDQKDAYRVWPYDRHGDKRFTNSGVGQLVPIPTPLTFAAFVSRYVWEFDWSRTSVRPVVNGGDPDPPPSITPRKVHNMGLFGLHFA